MVMDQFYELEGLINAAYGEEKVKLHHLDNNMTSFSGCNGVLTIKLIKEGFDISLSDDSLMDELKGALNQLLGFPERCEDKFLSDETSALPYWSVSEFDRVQAAVLRYAQTGGV